MDVCVIGLGYVGCVSAACLARTGHRVVGVDVQEEKLEALRTGRSPILEPGLDELVARAVADGRLRASSNLSEAVGGAEVSLICVGTPSRPDGDQDTAAVFRVIDQIAGAPATRDGHVLVLRSTVWPGTTRACAARLGEGAGRPLLFNPEFMREGTAIRDFDDPPYTVIGAEKEHGEAVETLRRLYAHLNAPFLVVPTGVAELLKYACNAFHAAKVVFANEIARLGEAEGVDATAVMDLLCRDERLNISRRYLRPGFAFGGSCLPKDVRATVFRARQRGVQAPLLEALIESNEAHIASAAAKIAGLGAARIGVLGIRFKADTDDVRESPTVRLVRRLLDAGLEVRIYDPNVRPEQLIGANRAYLEQHLPELERLLVSESAELVEHAELLVAATPDEEFVSVLRSLPPGKKVWDVSGFARPLVRPEDYHAMGW